MRVALHATVQQPRCQPPSRTRDRPRIAQRGYVLESGRTVIDGRSEDLLHSPEVRRIFLGG
jgi:ABC-type branched-subunit amino acid transport system ATPase component